MTYSVDISEAAEDDIRNPLKTQIRYSVVRIFFLKKFPYGIHFIVNGNTILISSCVCHER